MSSPISIPVNVTTRRDSSSTLVASSSSSKAFAPIHLRKLTIPSRSPSPTASSAASSTVFEDEDDGPEWISVSPKKRKGARSVSSLPSAASVTPSSSDKGVVEIRKVEKVVMAKPLFFQLQRPLAPSSTPVPRPNSTSNVSFVYSIHDLLHLSRSNLNALSPTQLDDVKEIMNGISTTFRGPLRACKSKPMSTSRPTKQQPQTTASGQTSTCSEKQVQRRRKTGRQEGPVRHGRGFRGSWGWASLQNKAQVANPTSVVV